MKTYGGRSGLRFMLLILYSRYPLGRELGGSQSPSGRCEEEIHLSSPTLLVQPLAYVL